MRRLAASIRLSALTDTTNSPRIQERGIKAYVTSHPDSRIDFWFKETDVSGEIPIAEREVGVLFTDEMLDQWDGIIGWRLDRLFRDQLDYLLWVRDIGKEYGKFIVDAEDGVDSSTPAGRRILNQRAEAAQYERERIAERRGNAQVLIRQEARYGGGPIPFGLRKAPIIDDDGITVGWNLELHEPYAAEARSWVERIRAGESANSIAVDLNRRNIPTSQDAQRILSGKAPRGAKWTAANLLRYLRSPALKGYVLNYPKKGEPRRPPTIVYGDDGHPIRRAAIIDDETWDELQESIKNVGKGGTTGLSAKASTLLLGVAHCGLCGGRLHSEIKHIRTGKPGRLYYYGCQNTHYRGCKARLIPRDELDDRVNEAMFALREVWPSKITRSHGDTRERRLKEIGTAMAELTQDQFVRGNLRPDYKEVMESLEAEYNRVRVEAPPPSVERETPIDETLADMYDRATLAERRSIMHQLGFTFRVYRDDADQLHISDVAFSKTAKLRITLPAGFTL
jgi:DNA invertase Pin-like site-specific DNA recombinase